MTLQDLLDDPSLLTNETSKCIYRITCIKNRKSYTGFTKDIWNRFHKNNEIFQGHLHRYRLFDSEFIFLKDKHLYYGMQFYGLKNFELQILYRGDNAEDLEEMYVSQIPKEFSYNRSKDGKGGFESDQVSDLWSMNNGIKEIRVPSDEHQLYLDNGWKDGRLIQMNQYHWYNNGKIQTRVFESDIIDFEKSHPEFKPGILPENNPPSSLGKIQITNGWKTAMHDPNKPLPDGWVKGIYQSCWPRVYDPTNHNRILFTIYPSEIEKYQSEGYYVVPAKNCSIEYHLSHPDDYPCFY